MGGRVRDNSSMNTRVDLPDVPFSLQSSEDWPWRVEADTVLVTAKPHSDFFIDPSGGGSVAAESQLNAVSLTGRPPEGDFTLTARVQVSFVDTFDAGVLIVWAGETRWAKLCFEYSPDRKPMVVSVVTRGVSDDANAFVVEGDQVWLRIARIGRVYAFHASSDGIRWEFVRGFALGAEDQEVTIGLEAQSPMGDGCDVRFDTVEYAAATLGNLRDGS